MGWTPKMARPFLEIHGLRRSSAGARKLSKWQVLGRAFAYQDLAAAHFPGNQGKQYKANQSNAERKTRQIKSNNYSRVDGSGLRDLETPVDRVSDRIHTSWPGGLRAAIR